jgi:hypothetical protein
VPKGEKRGALGCCAVFRIACGTNFFPAFLICSSSMEVGGLWAGSAVVLTRLCISLCDFPYKTAGVTWK